MFHYEQGALRCESVALAEIAGAVGTPCYVYSESALRDAYRAYAGALEGTPHRICYAVKANSNLAVLAALAAEGSGFDIVSGGELHRVLAAGGDPGGVVFSGVGKTAAEMEAALAAGIFHFNCESAAEIDQLRAVATCLGRVAPIALRINPEVDAATHPYISTGMREHKFGIALDDVPALVDAMRGMPQLRLAGVACHIGSQITDAAPLLAAAATLLRLGGEMRAAGFPLEHVNFGGGLAIPYRPGDAAPSIAGYVGGLRALASGSGFGILLEPGRSLVGPAGVLLARVLYRKRNGGREFVIVDAAMNDLLRPALYSAWHGILPLRAAPEAMVADVVGPVCETGDFLARARALPDLQPGDGIAIADAGAYGFALASNYNSRPRAAEVMVGGGAWRIVRERETPADLMRTERAF